MAITTAPVYITTDGKKFDDELEAKAHEKSLEIDAEVEAFLDAANVPKVLEANGRANPRRASSKSVIMKWEAYKG